MQDPQQQQSKKKTASDAEIHMAKKIIDQVFTPAIQSQVEALNRALKKLNIHAGVELTWFFDRIEAEGPADIKPQEASKQ